MKLFEKIKKNEFWASVIKLSSGQAIAQIITLAATLILSRIYTDADYGTYGIIISTSNIIISGIGLAMASAVMVADSEEACKRVFTVSYFAQLLLLVIVLGGMVALMPVKRFFQTSVPYVVMLGIVGIHIALNILSTMTRVYINRLKLNNVLFWNSLINAGCTVCISVPMGMLGFGFLGLLLSAMMAELLCVLQMLRVASPFMKIRSFEEVKDSFADCKKFILFQYPSNMMGTFANNLPDQTLYSSFGDAALGSYAMSQKVFRMPLNLLITPIQTIYFRTAAQMKDKLQALADFTFGFFKKMMLVAAVPMIACMAFGEYIFGFVLGWQWQEAGLIAAILCPYFFFWFCNAAITYLRVAIGQQKANLYMTILQLVCALLVVALAKILGMGVIGTIALFSGVNALFNLADITVSFVCMKKHYGKYLIISAGYMALCIALACCIRVLF